jgi:hypothetical protein
MVGMVVSVLGRMLGWWYCISALLSPTDDKCANSSLLLTNLQICRLRTTKVGIPHFYQQICGFADKKICGFFDFPNIKYISRYKI